MAFRFNPLTSELDLVNSTAGFGNVTGIPPTTDQAIARWVGTGGDTIENSLATIQDGGTIEAQAYAFRRSITEDVVINSGYSWVASELTIDSGTLMIESDGEVIIL